jgi:hypothetical protein
VRQTGWSVRAFESWDKGGKDRDWTGKVLTQHVSEGEIADIKHRFPTELRELWP